MMYNVYKHNIKILWGTKVCGYCFCCADKIKELIIKDNKQYLKEQFPRIQILFIVFYHLFRLYELLKKYEECWWIELVKY